MPEYGPWRELLGCESWPHGYQSHDPGNLWIFLYLFPPLQNRMAITLGWRRKWQPTPVLLPGKSHGRKSLVGYSPWGCRESDTAERLHFTHFTHFILYHWRRKWQPTPVFLPGESHGQGSLAGCGPWGHRESDTTEVTEQEQYWVGQKVCLGFFITFNRKAQMNFLINAIESTW